MNKQTTPTTSYLGSLFWVVRLQWRTSRFYFGWDLFRTVFNGLQPLLMAYVVAQLIATAGALAFQLEGVEPGQFYQWLVAILVLELAGVLVFELNEVVIHKSQIQMELAINEILIQKLYDLSQEQFDDPDFQTKLERAQQAALGLWRTTWQISQLASSVVRFGGAFLAIFWTSPAVALLVAAGLGPSIWIQVVVSRRQESIQRQAVPDRRIAWRSRWMLLDPRLMVEVRLMNAFQRMVRAWRHHYGKYNRRLYDGMRSLTKFEVMVRSISPIVNFGAMVHFFGRLISGGLSLDQFIFLRGMLESVGSGSQQLAESSRLLHQGVIDLRNFDSVYRAEPAIPDGSVTVKPPLTIEFDRVSFTYPGSQRPVLDNVSFRVEPGSHLALVGVNGAGKTTIIKLLLRQYLPTKGQIRVNGTPIANLDRNRYCAKISHLSQEFILFEHLTVRQNLTISLRGRLTDRQIYQVTDLVGASQLIRELPKRLDSRLASSFSDGTDLSAGQRQRLCVARALLADSSLLILDEPTSAIDAQGEKLIFDNIYQKYLRRAVLIISHRFSTVRQADNILVIDQGRIIEQGSHQQLMDQPGLYHKMFQLQAEGYR